MKPKSRTPVAKSKRAGRKSIARKSTPRAARQSSLADELSRIQRETGESDIRVAEDTFWLTRCGVLVDITIGFWRAKTTLTLADLGIPEPESKKEKEAFLQLINLGTRNLMPPEITDRLDSNDSGARKWVKQNSYPTCWGPWVDIGRYPRWKPRDQKFAQTHFAIRDEVCTPDNWAKIRKWNTRNYAIAGHQAYDRLAQLAPAVLVDKNGHTLARGEFVRQYVERALLKLPTREQVYSSFVYSTKLSYIPVPSALARDLAEKERIEAARLLERTAENAILQGERTRQLCDMDNDVTASTAANSPAVVQEFVRDLQIHCVSTVLAKIASVQAGIEKNQALVGKKSEQLRNALQSYQEMNLVGHPRLDDKVARLSEMLANPPNQRNLHTIVALLDEIAGIAKQTLAALKRAA